MIVRTVFRPKNLLPLTLMALLIALVLFAVYQVSHPAHLVHDHLLNSADHIGYAVCHRWLEHSFTIFGRSLPLCARCSGIYLGIVLTLATLRLARRQRHARFPNRRTMCILGLLILLMAIDGFNSLFHDLGWRQLYQPHNTLRLVTGFGTGIAIATTISVTFAQTAWRDAIWQPPIATLRELSLLLLLAGTLAIILLSNQTSLIYVLSIISAVGVLIILSMLYTTLVLIIMRHDGQIDRVRQLIIPCTLGLSLTIVQLVAISALRFNLTGTWASF